MDTPLLDLAPGLAVAARIVGEIPAGTGIDPPPEHPVHGASTESTEAEQDCKPD